MVQPTPRRDAEVHREPAQEVPGHLQRQLGLGGLEEGLWQALHDVVQLWVDRGVKLFRVDNPHTKPVPFWEWLIEEIRSRDPDVVFFAEAFTRPAMMQTLGKIGFGQSYTYFTWKNSRWELVEFVNGLLGWSDYYRPELLRQHAGHPPPLPAAGRPAGLPGAARPRRHALAELRDLLRLRALRERSAARGLGGVPRLREVRAQAEGLDGARLPLVRRLNTIRREHPSLQWLDLVWLDTENDDLAFAKKRGDVVVVVVNLNPFEEREGVVVLPAWIGLPPAVASATSSATTSCATHRAQLRPPRPGAVPRAGGGALRVSEAGQWFESDPLWFKRAVFYEIHTREFFDSDDDGSGDLQRIQEKLDYLQWLGIDCIWLLPMYGARSATAATTLPTSTPSTRTTAPSRISGTSSRRRTGAGSGSSPTSYEPPRPTTRGSRARAPNRRLARRDYYVWSDTDDRWEEARIIFLDTEASNWTWDPVRVSTTGTASSIRPDLNYGTRRCRRRC